jgi:UDP-N-acetylglucosamine transferase subunit ALG13
MIFVTVGAQMPFDRLIRAVDVWGESRSNPKIFAQIGPSSYRPKNMEFAQFVGPSEFRERVAAAKVVVAHAGMGSIITALEFGKPIIVMPRRGELRETRNDHQVATAKYFSKEGRVIAAFDEKQLSESLDQVDELTESIEKIRPQASRRLLSTIRAFIEEEPHFLDGTSRSGEYRGI